MEGMIGRSLQLRSSPHRLQRLVILGVLIGLALLMSVSAENFLTVNNINNVLKQTAFTVLTGAAALLLVVSGNIDLSVGSVLATTCVIFASLCKSGMGICLAALVSVAVGAMIGLVNAVVSVRFKIPAIIATIISMYVFRGFAYAICRANPVVVPFSVKKFSFLGRGYVAGIIPFPVVLMVGFVALFIFIEKKTLVGKYAVAIGGNRTSAILSGINVDRIQTVLFVLTGAMAGLSGALMASRLGSGDPTAGQGFEFDVMIAIILGGTNINGGEGSVVGAVIGAFIVGILNNGMNQLDIQSFYQFVVKGVVLALAIVFDQFMKSRIMAMGTR